MASGEISLLWVSHKILKDTLPWFGNVASIYALYFLNCHPNNNANFSFLLNK
jgi:hypothetical protein